MSERLRRFTDSGLRQFREALATFRQNPDSPPSMGLLLDPEHTAVVPGSATVDRLALTTKREAAEYLHRVLDPLRLPAILRDVGLWSWLALWFFDSLCPESGGRRRPLADPHYILDAANWQRRYRHLLLTPFTILEAIPDHNRIFLDSALSVHGEMIEQTVSRLFLFRLPGVRQAIDALYFDPERGRPRPGIFSTKTPKAGDLRNRLPTKVKQLQRTYDIAALNGPQLIDLLGPEFVNRLQRAAS